MPLDDRLRDALQSEAATIAPDEERHLERVRARSRRTAAPVGRFVVAAVAAIAVVVFIRTTTVDPVAVVMSMLGPTPTVEPSAAADPGDLSHPLAATYRVRLHDADATVAAHAMAGDWELTFEADSRITVVAPETFTESLAEPLSGYVYALRDDRLFTDLFSSHLGRGCAGPGDYRWTRPPGGLIFETVEDACPQRVALLTAGTWSRVTR